MKLKLNKRLRRTLSIFKAAGEKALEHDTLGMGAALAFYTIFTLGPLLVIATAVAALFIGSEETQRQLVNWAETYFGPEGAKAVQGMITGALNRFSGFLASVVGLVTLFFGVTGAFGRLKHSLNTIWRVEVKGNERTTVPLVVKRLAFTRLKALAVAALIGAMLFLGIIMSAAISSLGGLLGKWLPLPGGLLFLLNLLLSLLIVVPLFALIFKFLPDARVPWPSAWIGAAVTGVLFQLGSLLTGAYLGAKVLASVYGAAGSVLAVLLWAYYTAQTVFFGAEVCREVSRPADGAHAGAGEA